MIPENILIWLWCSSCFIEKASRHHQFNGLDLINWKTAVTVWMLLLFIGWLVVLHWLGLPLTNKSVCCSSVQQSTLSALEFEPLEIPCPVRRVLNISAFWYKMWLSVIHFQSIPNTVICSQILNGNGIIFVLVKADLWIQGRILSQMFQLIML